MIKRIVQLLGALLPGVCTLYLGGLFTLAVLQTAVLGGLLVPVIVGPAIVLVLCRKAAAAPKQQQQRTYYAYAGAFSVGFSIALVFWLYMVGFAVDPIAELA